jgi:hypothetical protein
MKKQITKTYFKTSPDLNDGEHWSILDTDKKGIQILLDQIEHWATEGGDFVGNEIKVEVIEMTDDEVEALSII